MWPWLVCVDMMLKPMGAGGLDCRRKVFCGVYGANVLINSIELFMRENSCLLSSIR